MSKLSSHDIGNIIFAAVFVLMVALILSCGVGEVINEIHAIDEGVIIDKRIALPMANNGTFRTTTYYFTIEGEKRGKTVRYIFEVPKDEYGSYRIGDWYKR